MGEIIKGKEVAKALRDSLAGEVVELGAKYGRTPMRVVILVGEDARQYRHGSLPVIMLYAFHSHVDALGIVRSVEYNERIV